MVVVVGDDPLPLRCSDCFALENMSLARLTPELLRFFSVVGLGPASLLLRPVGVDPFPAGVAAAAEASSPRTGAAVAGEDAGACLDESTLAGLSMAAPSSSLLEPNIRFNKPPPPAWEEKLRLLFPARVKVSRSQLRRSDGQLSAALRCREVEVVYAKAARLEVT
jgi:hypothetical protein